MTPSEKCNILHEVLVELKMVKDVSKKYRISTSRVNKLVHQAKKKPKFIEELFAKRDKKEQNYEDVKIQLEEMAARDDFVDSCEMVAEKVNS